MVGQFLLAVEFAKTKNCYKGSLHNLYNGKLDFLSASMLGDLGERCSTSSSKVPDQRRQLIKVKWIYRTCCGSIRAPICSICSSTLQLLQVPRNLYDSSRIID